MDNVVRVAHVVERPVVGPPPKDRLTPPKQVSHTPPSEPAGPPVDSVDKDPVSHPPPLPGDFLLAEYESDCARFVADARNLARRRTNRPLLASK
jgi:hypothetical protein